MKTRVLIAAFAICWSFSSVASAQTSERPPVKPPGSGIELAFGDGNFRSTDGTRGTYSDIGRFYSATSSSRTVTFVRNSDGAKRIETTTAQTSPGGTRTETFTTTDYNASSSFTSNLTITDLGHGQSVGQGIYMTPEGVSGTLTTLETQSTTGLDTIASVYNSATNGLSTGQRTQTVGSGKIIIKTAGVDASGKSTSVVETRTLNFGKPLTTDTLP